METKARYTLTNALSMIEMLLSGISSWLIGKLLDFVWRRSKKMRSQKKGNPSLLQLANLDICLLALLLDVYPAEIKFSMNRARKLGFFRGSLTSFFEVITYSVRNK